MSSQESEIYAPDLYQELMNEEGVADVAQDFHFSSFDDEVSLHEALATLEALPQQSQGNMVQSNEEPNSEKFNSAGSATGMLPPTDDFQSSSSFLLNVKESSYLKFSSSLKKIFVMPTKVVPVEVTWNVPSEYSSQKKFIRAVLVYNDPNRFQEPVKRCLVHRDKDNPWNKDHSLDVIEHVIISVNENSQHTVNDSSGRRSVLVPLQLSEGTTYSLVNYKLMCRTSCSRSDMDIIFTLENESGNVLGRKKLGVKICMAPERDYKKEERHHQPEIKSGKKKRKFTSEPEIIAKKQNIESLCTFKVVAASPEDAALTKDMLKVFNTYQEKLRGRAPIEKVIDNDVSKEETSSFVIPNQRNSDLSDLPKKEIID